MVCKGICIRYKAQSPRSQIKYKYDGNSQKRCSVCDEFITWDGRDCPCCGVKLRTKPHKKMQEIKVKRI